MYMVCRYVHACTMATAELTISRTGWGIVILEEMHSTIIRSHHNVALAGFMIHSAMGILQELFSKRYLCILCPH